MIDPSGDRMYSLSSDNMLIVWDVSPTGGFGAPRPGLDDRWITDEPAVVEPGELVVVPTRPFGTAVRGDWPYFGPGTAEVAATFVDPRTGEVVDEVAVGETLEESWIGASVAVSPDRGLIAVSSGLAVTVLDARSREPVTTFTVPAAGYPGPDGQPLPVGVVGCLAWTADGSRLLLGVQGGDPATSPPGGALLAVDTESWEIADEATVDVVPETIELSPDGRSRGAGGRVEHRTGDPGRGHAGRAVDRGPGHAMTGSRTCPGRRTAGCSSPPARAAGCTWSTRPRGRPSAPAAQRSDPPHADRAAARRSHRAVLAGWHVRLFDLERGVARNGLPAAVGNQQAATFMVPDPTDDLVILSDQDWVMSYPMTPSAWLRTACAIAGRDLTRAEWDRYLPGRPYRSTCTDLG